MVPGRKATTLESARAHGSAPLLTDGLVVRKILEHLMLSTVVLHETPSAFVC